MRKPTTETIKSYLADYVLFKEVKYPQEFEIFIGVKDYQTRRHFKLVQEYRNYARYVDLKTGLFECFKKIDFKDNNITILEE